MVSSAPRTGAGLAAVKVVIYDCDGVLIDSRRANAAFYNHLLEKFGLGPITPRQLDFVQSCTAREAVDFLFQGTPRVAAAQDYQLNIDNRPFLSLLRLEPHIREVLAALRPKYHTAIATNRGKSLPMVLKELGLEDLFDLTVSSYDVAQPKPHPECLLKILKHFRVEPEEAVYIGDAPVDLLVSRQAGVIFAAYKNPGLEAQYHLQDHRDLLEILPGFA
ncbi:MAG: HAD family hydrolase [Deltaproteobacteria bacterium]|nr:MAG: HAD family hydrolase [Deltaproteobacteria bacterium]